MNEFWDSYNKGRQATLGVLGQARVGGALARGDTAAAAREAYRLGDYDTGSQIEALNRANEDRARRSAIGNQIASGDLEGARTAALQQGDVKLANDVQEMLQAMSVADKAKLAAKTAILGRAAYSLARIPYDQRKATIEAVIRPELLRQGFTAQEVDAFDPSDANIESTWRNSLELEDLLAIDAKAQEAQWRQEDRIADNERQDRRDAATAEDRSARRGLAERREGRIAAGGGRSRSGASTAPRTYGSGSEPVW